MSAFDDRVFDYVLGTLDDAERAAFEADLVRAPALRAMCREAEELLALSATTMPPVEPSPALRERVLASTVPDGWTAAVERMAALWDLSVDAVRSVLARAMDPAQWEDGPLPGTRLFHLDGGPATAGADVGIVRFEAGLVFPPHGHGESETYVVLEGELHDSSGAVERAGELWLHPGDEVHHFVVSEDGAAYIALVLRGGLTFPGA